VPYWMTGVKTVSCVAGARTNRVAENIKSWRTATWCRWNQRSVSSFDSFVCRRSLQPPGARHTMNSDIPTRASVHASYIRASGFLVVRCRTGTFVLFCRRSGESEGRVLTSLPKVIAEHRRLHAYKNLHSPVIHEGMKTRLKTNKL